MCGWAMFRGISRGLWYASAYVLLRGFVIVSELSVDMLCVCICMFLLLLRREPLSWSEFVQCIYMSRVLLE